MQYREDPHGAEPPQRGDGSVAFEQLIPQHRREYLDGWGHATVGTPAKRPPTAGRYFSIGIVEATNPEAFPRAQA